MRPESAQVLSLRLCIERCAHLCMCVYRPHAIARSPAPLVCVRGYMYIIRKMQIGMFILYACTSAAFAPEECAGSVSLPLPLPLSLSVSLSLCLSLFRAWRARRLLSEKAEAPPGPGVAYDSSVGRPPAAPESASTCHRRRRRLPRQRRLSAEAASVTTGNRRITEAGRCHRG